MSNKVRAQMQNMNSEQTERNVFHVDSLLLCGITLKAAADRQHHEGLFISREACTDTGLSTMYYIYDTHTHTHTNNYSDDELWQDALH